MNLLVAHRVSLKQALLAGSQRYLRILPPNRWRVKISLGARNPFVVRDASRPSFLGQYPTLERALLYIDNKVRAERNMPARIDWQAINPNIEMLNRTGSVDGLPPITVNDPERFRS